MIHPRSNAHAGCSGGGKPAGSQPEAAACRRQPAAWWLPVSSSLLGHQWPSDSPDIYQIHVKTRHMAAHDLQEPPKHWQSACSGTAESPNDMGNLQLVIDSICCGCPRLRRFQPAGHYDLSLDLRPGQTLEAFNERYLSLTRSCQAGCKAAYATF